MKVILSGGGTGGHIYPALTIADQIKAIRPDVEITFVGTRQGLEKDIIPRYGYNLEFIDVAGFKRSLSLDTLRSGIKLLHGLKDAYSLLDKLKPDLVIGTGGYVCGPIVFLASLKGIPTCIQEQNAMPGVTNKILARYVRKVFLGIVRPKNILAVRQKRFLQGILFAARSCRKNVRMLLLSLGLMQTKKLFLYQVEAEGPAASIMPCSM